MSKVSEEFVVPVAVAHTFSSSSLEAEVVDLRGQPGKPYLENKTKRGGGRGERKKEKERRKRKGKGRRGEKEEEEEEEEKQLL